MRHKLKKIDLGIVVILLCFMAFSTLIIYSATHNHPLYEKKAFEHIIYFTLGFVVVIGSVFVDYRIVLKFWYVFLIIGVIMLALVYAVGPEINGAKGWFKIKSFSFQPAEIVKLFIIIGLAAWMGKRKGEKLTFYRDLVPIGLIVGIPFILVLITPDLGNAIIYLVILVGMLWIGNMKYSHVLIGLTVVVAGLVLSVSLFNTYNTEIADALRDKGKYHWYSRINTFINPEEASPAARYQVENAQIAIGTGGLTGKGFMEGSIKNAGLVPYTYSDSIFSVVGEEFGFQGSAILLLFYFLLIYRMIVIAYRCYDLRAAYIVVGVISMFVFQIFENIGMMIGIMPVTGITLPFVSYGGTSLLLNMLSIGIILSINAHQYKYELDD
ncbi:FtsW/RodA/SpoVE family cell cycle protein [Paenibacillus yanchengensis]|uniref:FtsW/RodA/SpoVE family cell cycle protein n=1 Tax=Paenibacillus yanchengensis TaxID=2035833 RepID=A0ABW4YLV3_9BACL